MSLNKFFKLLYRCLSYVFWFSWIRDEEEVFDDGSRVE